MKKKFVIIITYILIFFNSNALSNENNNILKIGLLAPLSGEYKELGESLLYSLQLALDEIGDKNVHVIPRDSGSNDKQKLNIAVEDIKSEGANIIIGPIEYIDFDEIKKFNEGGINYLPSKIDHDEQDTNNYIRASGYVEDGAGVGDKDEDTMLAQLADGEFVSRADAILGAGIMEGGNPKSYKDMRKKGAAFFYDQQAKFKRIFDLLDASRKKAN